MKTDLHIHTPYCGHASGSAEETVIAAIKKGFSLIGFSEHLPYPEDYIAPVPDCVAPMDEWTNYLDDISTLQTTFMEKIDIRIGAEIDYLPGRMEKTSELLKKFSYDYIYGSVHLVDDICIDYKDEYLKEHLEALGGPDGLWEKYWCALEELIQLDICDILSHLDLPGKLESAQPSRDQTDAMRHVLELAHEHELVLELNTGGIDRSYTGYPYPSLDILKHARELNMEMTFGSDAHAPDQVGRHHEYAMDIFRRLGWERLVVFKSRKKEYVKLA